MSCCIFMKIPAIELLCPKPNRKCSHSSRIAAVTRFVSNGLNIELSFTYQGKGAFKAKLT